jgi:hypothetical protein
METDYSLSAPRADDRTPRPKGPAGRNGQQQRRHTPKQHHASAAHAKPARATSHARDYGDRRDRKGHDVWSNSGAPPKYRKQQRKPAPQRG